LAGAVGALVDRGLRATPDVFAHPAVEFVLGALALGHSSLPVRRGPALSEEGAIATAASHQPVMVFRAAAKASDGKAGCMTVWGARVKFPPFRSSPRKRGPRLFCSA